MSLVKKSAELKDVDVHLISFVDKGANKRNLIYKHVDGSGDNIQYLTPIVKVDDEKHLVYCVVYAPNDPDYHDDFMTTDEVEKAAHRFLAKSNTTKAMDTQHNLEIADGLTIVESAINKGHEYFPDAKDKDAWYIAVKVENTEIWKGIKDGTYTGVSLYGFAKRIEDADSAAKAIGKKVLSGIAKAFGLEDDIEDGSQVVKDFNDEIVENNIWSLINALTGAVYDILDDENVTDLKGALLESIDQFRAKVDSVISAKSLTVVKAGKTISAANLDKIKAAMKVMEDLVASAEGTAEKREKLIKKFKKTTMENTDNKVEKSEHDKIVADKDAEIKKLKEDNERLANASKGSNQIVGDPEKKEAETVKKEINWFGRL